MVSILFYSFLSSIHIFICGYIFHHILINKEFSIKSNFCELAIYGGFFLGFISLFLNFFTSLNKSINTLIFIAPIIIFFIFFYKKELLKKIIFFSFVISIFFLLTVSFDTTYRPDAGLYHLPYISVLNESKIIIGLSNIHFRFGHVSILQYLSSIYNNYIFNENGISIISCIIYLNLIGYILFEIFKKKNDKNLKILSFIFLIFILFKVNRYSDFGNDALANLLFFYLIIESLKNHSQLFKIKKTTLAATFVFLNKITLLLGFLIPLFLIFQQFKFKNLFNKITIFSFVFLLFFIIKNILVSGCAIFPAEQTCFKNLFWYDKSSDRNSNASVASIENEAWAKGWFNQEDKIKDFKEFSNNFNWIQTWLESDFKKSGKKLLPFIIFLFLLLIISKIYEINFKSKISKKFIIDINYFKVLIICLVGSLFWFLKFPVFRYGYGYLISSLAILISIYLTKFNFLNNQLKLKKIFLFITIFLIFGVMTKNSLRIYSGYKLNNNPWPNIYNAGNIHEKKENIPVIKDEKVIFFSSKDGECYYSKSPCTRYFKTKEYDVEDINYDNKNGYKIFYFKN